MKVTRIDLNSWIVQLAEKTILIDPWLVDPLVFYGMPWLFTAEHNTPLSFTPSTLPAIDLILLSQGLDDHCHRPTLEQLDRQIPVIASPTAARVVRELGYQSITALSPWQTTEVESLKITAIPGAEIQPGQIENGYLLSVQSAAQSESILEEALYYEPHLFPVNEAVQQRIGAVDVAIAPVVGQQFPLLGQVIMGPEQALQLAKTLKPRFLVPTAQGDIRTSGILPLLIKTIGSVEEFYDRLVASGLPTQLLTPKPGETLEIAPVRLAHR